MHRLLRAAEGLLKALLHGCLSLALFPRKREIEKESIQPPAFWTRKQSPACPTESKRSPKPVSHIASRYGDYLCFATLIQKERPSFEYQMDDEWTWLNKKLFRSVVGRAMGSKRREQSCSDLKSGREVKNSAVSLFIVFGFYLLSPFYVSISQTTLGTQKEAQKLTKKYTIHQAYGGNTSVHFGSPSQSTESCQQTQEEGNGGSIIGAGW